MTSSSDSAIAFSLPPGEVPLGIQYPLLAPPPLGQSMLQPKFLTPLGTRSLSVLDPALMAADATPAVDLPSPFQDSPEPADLAGRSPAVPTPPIQRQPVQAQPPTRLPELSRDAILSDSESLRPELTAASLPESSADLMPEAMPPSQSAAVIEVEPVTEVVPTSNSEGFISKATAVTGGDGVVADIPRSQVAPEEPGKLADISRSPEELGNTTLVALLPMSPEAELPEVDAQAEPEEQGNGGVAPTIGPSAPSESPIPSATTIVHPLREPAIPAAEPLADSVSPAATATSGAEPAAFMATETETETETAITNAEPGIRIEPQPLSEFETAPTPAAPNPPAPDAASTPDLSLTPLADLTTASTTEQVAATAGESPTVANVGDPSPLTSVAPSSPPLQLKPESPAIDPGETAIQPDRPLASEPPTPVIDMPTPIDSADADRPLSRPVETTDRATESNPFAPPQWVNHADPFTPVASDPQPSIQLKTQPESQLSGFDIPMPLDGVENVTPPTIQPASELPLESENLAIAPESPSFGDQVEATSTTIQPRLESSAIVPETTNQREQRDNLPDAIVQQSVESAPIASESSVQREILEPTAPEIRPPQLDDSPIGVPTEQNSQPSFDNPSSIAPPASIHLKSLATTPDAPPQQLANPDAQADQEVPEHLDAVSEAIQTLPLDRSAIAAPLLSDQPEATPPTPQLSRLENPAITPARLIQPKQLEEPTQANSQPPLANPLGDPEVYSEPLTSAPDSPSTTTPNAPPNATAKPLPIAPAPTFPELPTSVQRRSVWEPLVQLQPLPAFVPPTDPQVMERPAGQGADRYPEALIHRKADSTAPPVASPAASLPQPLPNQPPITDWSSIAELLQASTEPQSGAQAEFWPPEPDSPPTQDVTTADGYTDLHLYPEAHSSPFNQIQRAVEPPAAPPAPASESATSPAAATQPGQASASPEQLERLAQEMYRLVRQRLALDRERVGNIYSGRLR